MPEEPSLFCSLFVVVLKVPGATDPLLVFCAVVSSYKAVEMVTSLYKAFFFFNLFAVSKCFHQCNLCQWHF